VMAPAAFKQCPQLKRVLLLCDCSCDSTSMIKSGQMRERQKTLQGKRIISKN